MPLSFQLYKNVFCPDVGSTLAFIGFVQPASGGVLTMSETQSRWWAELCRGRITLPTVAEMRQDIDKEMVHIDVKHNLAGKRNFKMWYTALNVPGSYLCWFCVQQYILYSINRCEVYVSATHVQRILLSLLFLAMCLLLSSSSSSSSAQ